MYGDKAKEAHQKTKQHILSFELVGLNESVEIFDRFSNKILLLVI